MNTFKAPDMLPNCSPPRKVVWIFTSTGNMWAHILPVFEFATVSKCLGPSSEVHRPASVSPNTSFFGGWVSEWLLFPVWKYHFELSRSRWDFSHPAPHPHSMPWGSQALSECFLIYLLWFLTHAYAKFVQFLDFFHHSAFVLFNIDLDVKLKAFFVKASKQNPNPFPGREDLLEDLEWLWAGQRDALKQGRFPTGY